LVRPRAPRLPIPRMNRRVSVRRRADGESGRGRILAGGPERELVQIRLADDEGAGRPRRQPITGASSGSTTGARTREAAVVGRPRTSMMSLTEIGMPCCGPP
jgi:hypothetical protein